MACAVERYEYDAYGNCHVLEPNYAPDPDGLTDYSNPYLFTGRRVDILDNSSLKIQYNRNRYYDQYTGRWTTHDTWGVDPKDDAQNPFDPLGQYIEGVNLYQYIWSNPLGSVDPYGFWDVWKDECGIIRVTPTDPADVVPTTGKCQRESAKPRWDLMNEWTKVIVDVRLPGARWLPGVGRSPGRIGGGAAGGWKMEGIVKLYPKYDDPENYGWPPVTLGMKCWCDFQEFKLWREYCDCGDGYSQLVAKGEDKGWTMLMEGKVIRGKSVDVKAGKPFRCSCKDMSPEGKDQGSRIGRRRDFTFTNQRWGPI